MSDINDWIDDLNVPRPGHTITVTLVPEQVRALKELVKKPKREPFKKVFEHAGCRCERVPGSKLGRRGSARRRYGYIITHLATGKTDQLIPNADCNVKPRQAKIHAETWAKLCELEEERYTGV